MGEVVSVADNSDLGKPVLATLTGVGEEPDGNVVEDVARKVADHAKEGELFQVEKGLTRETASKEENNWFRCFGVQFQQALCCLFYMLNEDGRF